MSGRFVNYCLGRMRVEAVVVYFWIWCQHLSALEGRRRTTHIRMIRMKIANHSTATLNSVWPSSCVTSIRSADPMTHDPVIPWGKVAVRPALPACTGPSFLIFIRATVRPFGGEQALVLRWCYIQQLGNLIYSEVHNFISLSLDPSLTWQPKQSILHSSVKLSLCFL
jgi:hypothetical protein